MKRYILLLGLGAIAAGVLVFSWVRDDGAEDDSPDLSEVPDVQIESVRVREYDGSGTLLYDLQSSKIEQYLERDIVLVDDPSFTVKTPSNPRQIWTLSAESGEILTQFNSDNTQADQRVELLGEVHVTSTVDNQTELSLVGHNLSYYPSIRILKSNHPVKLTMKEATLEGGNFEMDLSQELIQLSSSSERRVHVTYPYREDS